MPSRTASIRPNPKSLPIPLLDLSEFSGRLPLSTGWTRQQEGLAPFCPPWLDPSEHAAQSAPITLTVLGWSLRLVSSGTSSAGSLQERLEHLSHAAGAFEKRIFELKDEADAEGYPFSADSLDTLRRFLGQGPILKPGRLVLMENGNLRATWSAERDSHVGLQFLPSGDVQYVIFTRRPRAAMTSRTHGKDTIAGIRRQLDAFDLYDLLGA